MSEKIPTNSDAFEFKNERERERNVCIGPVLDQVQETLALEGYTADHIADMSPEVESSINAQALADSEERDVARALFDLHQQLAADIKNGNSVEGFCTDHPQFSRLVQYALTHQDASET